MRSRSIRIKRKIRITTIALSCHVMSAYLNTPVTNLSASPNHLSMSEPALIFMNVAPHSYYIKEKKKIRNREEKIL